MNTNNQQAQSQAQFVQPKAYRKGDYLTLVLPGNVIVRKHINFYLKVLGLPFTPVKPATQETAEARA